MTEGGSQWKSPISCLNKLMRFKVVWSKHLFMHSTWLDPEIKTKLGYLTSDLQNEKLWRETSNTIRCEKQKIVSNASYPIIIFIFDNYRFYRFIVNEKLKPSYNLATKSTQSPLDIKCDEAFNKLKEKFRWWWYATPVIAGFVKVLLVRPCQS